MLDRTREILKELNAQVPRRLVGVDRLTYQDRLVSRLPDEDKEALMITVDSLAGATIEKAASDIDMGGGGCAGRVWYRVHGRKTPDESVGLFQPDETNLLLLSMLMERQKELLFKHRNLDFSWAISVEGRQVRFRGDMYFDLNNLALNMRLIANTIRPFKSLGLHPTVARALSLEHNKQGLTLVTGVTGSGKSTTLDSIVDANNSTVEGHIVIIGWPIETVHDSKRCIVRHREVGRDVMSFKEGAVQALRQDPDIIIIGEMRDADTIDTALEITDSGHKVFSTLHTASAVESIDRIIGESPPEEQDRIRNRLADTLTCVISQKLVPALQGKLVLAKEVMLATTSVRAAIKNNNTGEIYQMINEGSGHGMVTMEQDLKRLCSERIISRDEAMNFANNKKRMEELLQVP